MKSGKGYIDRVDDLIKTNRSLWFFCILFVVLFVILLKGYYNLSAHLVVKVDLPQVIEAKRSGVITLGLNSANDLYYQIFQKEKVVGVL